MAVKMLERKKRNTDLFIHTGQTDLIPLDSERVIWIRSGLDIMNEVFDISFGVFKNEDCSSFISSFSLENQNLLTLADLSKISDIMLEYLAFMVNKRCHRRTRYKADEITFSPINWGRYIATKRVLRKAMKEFSFYKWEFKEEEENGVKNGSVKITIN